MPRNDGILAWRRVEICNVKSSMGILPACVLSSAAVTSASWLLCSKANRRSSKLAAKKVKATGKRLNWTKATRSLVHLGIYSKMRSQEYPSRSITSQQPSVKDSSLMRKKKKRKISVTKLHPTLKFFSMDGKYLCRGRTLTIWNLTHRLIPTWKGKPQPQLHRTLGYCPLCKVQAVPLSNLRTRMISCPIVSKTSVWCPMTVRSMKKQVLKARASFRRMKSD